MMGGDRSTSGHPEETLAPLQARTLNAVALRLVCLEEEGGKAEREKAGETHFTGCLLPELLLVTRAYIPLQWEM